MEKEILQDLEQQNKLLQAINSSLKKKMKPANSEWTQLHGEKLTKPNEIKKVSSEETSFQKLRANSQPEHFISLSVLNGFSTISHIDRRG